MTSCYVSRPSAVCASSIYGITFPSSLGKRSLIAVTAVTVLKKCFQFWRHDRLTQSQEEDSTQLPVREEKVESIPPFYGMPVEVSLTLSRKSSRKQSV